MDALVENKLFDEDDELGASTIADLSISSEEEETSLNNVWDHAIDTLFKLSTIHPDGNSLQSWVQYQKHRLHGTIFPWDQ